MVLVACLCQQVGGMDRPLHCVQGKALLGSVGQAVELDIIENVRSVPVPGAWDRPALPVRGRVTGHEGCVA